MLQLFIVFKKHFWMAKIFYFWHILFFSVELYNCSKTIESYNMHFEMSEAYTYIHERTAWNSGNTSIVINLCRAKILTAGTICSQRHFSCCFALYIDENLQSLAPLHFVCRPFYHFSFSSSDTLRRLYIITTHITIRENKLETIDFVRASM